MSLSKTYWDLVHSLIRRGITSEEHWWISDRSEYNFYMTVKKKGFKVNEIMCDVRRYMAWSKTAYDFAILDIPVDDIRGNRVFDILKSNGYDPQIVGTVFLKWCGLLSPRNTIWFSGGSQTQALEMSEALAHVAPLVSYAKPEDPENPFRGMKSSLVFYWGFMPLLDSHAPLVLKIFKGEHTQLDASNEEYFRTPCVVFANANMLAVKSTAPARKNAYHDDLKDCMYRIHLRERVPFSRGPVSVDDMRQFITWVSLNQKQFTDKHNVYECAES